MVQTQLFQCTSSWNHLTRWVFSSESQFQHLTINNKEWELKRAKSLQQAQVQSAFSSSSFLTAQLSARQLIHSKQPPHGTNFQQAKKYVYQSPFESKLHFWLWLTAYYICWIAMGRSFCQKYSSYYCKCPSFAWKIKNSNSSLAVFSWNIRFMLLLDCLRVRVCEHLILCLSPNSS